MERADDYTDAAHRRVWDDADRLFHRQIAVMTGNEVLLAMADLVAATMDEPLWKQLRDDSIAVAGRMSLHVAEHRLIYEAVTRGDAEAAGFYVREHLMRVRRNMALD
jgi:DNA-binding FadR family transcriptional regulator